MVSNRSGLVLALALFIVALAEIQTGRYELRVLATVLGLVMLGVIIQEVTRRGERNRS